MAEVPSIEEMPKVLKETVEKAEAELDAGEIVKLAGVMRALCLELTDIGLKYFISFGLDGKSEASEESPGLEPMLSITTNSETLHNMATGVTEPARAFAMRKVKLAGVPLVKLMAAGNLLDVIFRCYREAVGP